MSNNGLYSEEDEKFVKRLLEKSGYIYDELINRFGLSKEQIVAMFQSFRRNNFRVFPIVKCGDVWLVLKDEYMKYMGYNDKIKTKTNYFKILVASDTHFGSINDNPGIMDKVENFCESQGIQHIILLGDIIEGAEYYVKKYAKGEYRCETNDEAQLEYLNRNLPYNKNTIKHCLLSNHDEFSDDGIARDIVKQLHDAYGREDVVVSGFDYAELPVNGDTLYLNHGYLKEDKEFLNFNYDEQSRLYLCGHSHRSRSKSFIKQSCHIEYVTTLSNIEHTNKNRPPEENNFYTGFITLEIEQNDNGTFREGLITKYITTNSHYSRPKQLPGDPIEINFSRVRK